MSTQFPKCLLFDLGGVIVPWVGMIELSRMTGRPETDLIKTASNMPIFAAYEIGDCTTEEFLSQAPQLFGLNVSTDAFAKLWNEWVQPPYEGTREALLSLKPQFHLACLSNTNASHWDYLAAAHNIIDVFDHAYASHEIKAAKPDRNAWDITLNDMGLDPKDVWFFDDTMANIEAARKLGIESFHVDRNLGVLPLLRQLNLLKGD